MDKVRDEQNIKYNVLLMHMYSDIYLHTCSHVEAYDPNVKQSNILKSVWIRNFIILQITWINFHISQTR